MFGGGNVGTVSHPHIAPRERRKIWRVLRCGCSRRPTGPGVLTTPSMALGQSSHAPAEPTPPHDGSACRYYSSSTRPAGSPDRTPGHHPASRRCDPHSAPRRGTSGRGSGNGRRHGPVPPSAPPATASPSTAMSPRALLPNVPAVCKNLTGRVLGRPACATVEPPPTEIAWGGTRRQGGSWGGGCLRPFDRPPLHRPLTHGVS
jgi:hypothetical protein